MPKVIFKNENIETMSNAGTCLSQIFRECGLSIETPCNGNGTCGKCVVSVRENPDEKIKEVLACQYHVDDASEDLLVYTTQNNNFLVSLDYGKSIEAELNCDICIKAVGGLVFETQEPFINKVCLGGANTVVLNKIARLEKEKSTAPLYAVFCNSRILDIITEPNPLGLAIDLGTTGISVLLLSLKTGEVLAKDSFLNPQYEYGGDVLSRVSFCMEEDGNTRRLQELVIARLNKTLSAFGEKGYNPGLIYRVVVAGNTVMQHIFAAVDPALLTKNPYRPLFNDSLDLSLPGLQLNPSAVTTILPAISSYIGGDIVAGIISTGFDREKRNALFIDIGTNGEIALIINGELWATSTAAGPAFEGMNISCGQRAADGAIEAFNADCNGEISFSTIGDAEPTGVCGSGLIDLTAVLLKTGLLDAFGRLAGKKYQITGDITLLQRDIRQIQLAKGAVAAGIKMLLAEAGGSYTDLGVIYIAGAFGYHLNAESLKTVGIIDPSYNGEIVFAGNSSLEGARLALLSKSVLERMKEIKNKVKSVELSHRGAFQDVFVNELRFAQGGQG